jgi:hypothetical protein
MFARIGLPFLIALALCMAASVAAQNPAPAPVGTTSTTESPCADAPDQPDNSTLMWRARAHRHLDCLMSMIDQRLAKAGPITLTREELQDMRMQVLWAKDAAARIGR